jgi:hypothetical protein
LPTAKLEVIQAWSYSRFGVYTACPYKAKLQFIDKLKEPDFAAGIEGTRVHAIAAAYTTGKLPTDREAASLLPELKAMLASKRVPKELETFAEEFQMLRKAKALCEEQWTFDRNWNYLPDGWFSSQAWLRVKVDSHYLEAKKKGNGIRETTVHIQDHKTGKVSVEHSLQRSLYALAAFQVYLDCVKVTAAHWYLTPGKLESETWERSQLDKLKKDWALRTTAMLHDTTFTPNPSAACRWCHFRKSNGGPCIF